MRMNRKSTSIKWKIFAYLLGFCVLVLVLLWLFQTVFLESFYTSIKFSEVEQEAEALATLIENGDNEALQSSLDERGDLFVEVVGRDGDSYTAQPQNAFFEGAAPDLVMAGHKEALWKDVEENGGSLTLRYDAANQPEFMQDPGAPPPGGGPEFRGEMQQRESILCAKIVTDQSGNERLVLVSAPLTPVNATVETLRVQLIYVSIIVLVLSVGLALLLAYGVSRPIEKLNRSAGRLAQGDFDVPFDAEGYREVVELSNTLSNTAQELGKTEELRRDLIANVSHDLRTPLTLITGYAEMMRDIPGEDTPENMQVIIDEAKRLSSLVGDLLDLSRLQAGTVEMRFERFNLTREIAEIIERVAKFSEPEGIAVRFEHAGDAMVFADDTRISQVVYNFIINAMNYVGEDREVTLRQTLEADRVKIEVEDHGAGIQPDQLPYIWDRYYKVDEPHKRAAAGTGLGLAIVKSILEQHPGIRYGAESQPGLGSTFWFSLPREK